MFESALQLRSKKFQEMAERSLTVSCHIKWASFEQCVWLSHALRWHKSSSVWRGIWENHNKIAFWIMFNKPITNKKPSTVLQLGGQGDWISPFRVRNRAPYDAIRSEPIRSEPIDYKLTLSSTRVVFVVF